MSNVKFNQDSYGQNLIMDGLLALVNKEGYTPYEAVEILEKIGNDIFFILVEIEEKRGRNK